MKAAELFVKCLENEDVEYIFGVPGEENVDIMDALIESSIRLITIRHEQGAAFMADMYGRLTGKAGVCLSTLSPRATFKNPDFVKYAESFRAKGYRVERAVDLAPILKRALADDTVVIVDCPVDYSENMKLTKKLKELTSPV